jgi:hypothetical protein
MPNQSERMRKSLYNFQRTVNRQSAWVQRNLYALLPHQSTGWSKGINFLPGSADILLACPPSHLNQNDRPLAVDCAWHTDPARDL